MKYNITLNDPWFEYVKSGQKKYEGRCFWKSALNYKIGDTLEVSHHTKKETEPFCVRIEGILRFKTFEEALKVMNLSEVLPGVQTVQEGVEIYYKFVSLKTQEANGVCMLRVARESAPTPVKEPIKEEWAFAAWVYNIGQLTLHPLDRDDKDAFFTEENFRLVPKNEDLLPGVWREDGTINVEAVRALYEQKLSMAVMLMRLRQDPHLPKFPEHLLHPGQAPST